MEVVKGGAETGWTRGRVNEIKSGINLLGGPPGGTTEYCVMSGSRSGPFGIKGDSGAWVLRPGGALVGMFIGGNKAGSWSYVTPILDVIKDIEKTLSCSVELP